jgi:hypothetical protein
MDSFTHFWELVREKADSETFQDLYSVLVLKEHESLRVEKLTKIMFSKMKRWDAIEALRILNKIVETRESREMLQQVFDEDIVIKTLMELGCA